MGIQIGLALFENNQAASVEIQTAHISDPVILLPVTLEVSTMHTRLVEGIDCNIACGSERNAQNRGRVK